MQPDHTLKYSTRQLFKRQRGLKREVQSMKLSSEVKLSWTVFQHLLLGSAHHQCLV